MTLPALRERGRVSDEAIVVAIRLAVFLVFLSLFPGLVWLFSL